MLSGRYRFLFLRQDVRVNALRPKKELTI